MSRAPTSARPSVWILLALVVVLPMMTGHTAAEPEGAQAAVPLFLSIEPYDPALPNPRPGAHSVWRVVFNHEQIRQPAGAIRINVPGLREHTAPVEYWSPRSGYIDAPNPDHPTGLNQIPDPNARPEDFSWRWEGHSLTLTAYRGMISGTVTGSGGRWFRITPYANGVTLLYEPSGSSGPPVARPVSGLNRLALATLMAACLLMALRHFHQQRATRHPLHRRIPGIVKADRQR